MSRIVLDANSGTLTLNGRVFNSLVEGDSIVIESINNTTEQVPAENGGVTIQGRVDSGVSEVTINCQTLGSDDQFLNAIEQSAATNVLNGSFKQAFSEDGVAKIETYTLQNGSVLNAPTRTKNNQTPNAIMSYVVRFNNVIRTV